MRGAWVVVLRGAALWRWGMHSIFFGLKRAHLCVLRVTRVLLRGRELTPARFDMMRIVARHPFGVAQSKIQALLGVSAATVSRMLKSLELLGFVVRKRLIEDGRCSLVEVTRLGRDRVTDAAYALVHSGVAERMVLRGLGFERRAARPRMKSLQRALSSMRRIYGDRSPFEHPWFYGDLVPLVFTTLVDGRITYGEGLQ